MALQVECYIAEVTTARTLTHVLEETARTHGDSPALRQPVDGQPGGYLTYTWKQYLAAAREIAAGLDALGIRKGDVVALDSETRLEFYLADLGILGNGSVAAAVYPSYPPADLIRTIETVGATRGLRGEPEDVRGAARGESGALVFADGRSGRRDDARGAARIGTQRP